MSEQITEEITQDPLTQPDGVPPITVAPPTEVATADPRKRPNIYGSFWMAETEFAIEASMIQEVVPLPDVIAPMPLAPSYMKGLFNLRGTIVPMIDLRQLLHLPHSDTSEQKVAIIEDGELCIGLIIDRTGEVLNVQGAARVEFRARHGEPKDVVVEGLLKLDDGQRIIQVLDPRELLNLKKVPRGERMIRERPSTASLTRGRRFNCISFQFGHTTCAIDLSHVQEVMEAPDINDSMIVHDCFVGVVNLRGHIMPVADFRNFMGDDANLADTTEVPPTRKMLVIRTDGGLVGLLVYSIDRIMTCFEDEVLQFTKLALPRAEIVRGCLVGKGSNIIMLLDDDALRSDPMLVDTARRCQEVHATTENTRSYKKQLINGDRLTFIVFTIVTRFALDSSRVSEVISYPDELLKPPYALDFIDGIVNLRGELITLINPRTLYDLPKVDRENARVVIFLHEGRKYGFVVDGVDEIVVTGSNMVADKMTLNHNDQSLKIVEDDGGCIQSNSYGAVMILDTGAFLKRCFAKANGALLEAPDPQLALASPPPEQTKAPAATSQLKGLKLMETGQSGRP